MITLSVVLPNYNGKELLEKYLPSLCVSLSKANVKHEIIIVDDCSTDESCAFLEKSYPDIKILKNKTNLGFSKTCNIGIAEARYNYICVCNTDVEFEEDYFVEALRVLNLHKPFALKGDILNFINGEFSNTDRVCKLIFKSGLYRFKCNVEPDINNFGFKVGQQFMGLGCCFIAEREKLLELGGFNEIFSPFYWEDSDLCIRALQKGYQVYYAPQCKVRHFASSTISKKSKTDYRKRISNRNKFLFTWMHISNPWFRFRHFVYLAYSLLLRWIVMDWTFYRSLFAAWKRYGTRKEKIWSCILNGNVNE